MLYPDIWIPTKVESQKIIHFSERLRAFLADFFLLSPILTLSLSSWIQEIKWEVLHKNSKADYLFFAAIGACLFLGIFSHLMFWYFAGSTPGQRLFWLKIVDDSGHAQIKFSQALIRSVGWWVSLLALGIPFLKTFTDRNQRLWFEHLSHTHVVRVNP